MREDRRWVRRRAYVVAIAIIVVIDVLSIWLLDFPADWMIPTLIGLPVGWGAMTWSYRKAERDA